jgi:hypothetical protein
MFYPVLEGYWGQRDHFAAEQTCLGRERFEMLVGAAVLANNLMVIAGLLTKKSKKNQRHRAAA